MRCRWYLGCGEGSGVLCSSRRGITASGKVGNDDCAPDSCSRPVVALVRFGRLCSCGFQVDLSIQAPWHVGRKKQEGWLAGWQPYNSRAKVAKRPPVASRKNQEMASLSEADFQTRPQEKVSRADHMQGVADEAEAATANWAEMRWMASPHMSTICKA
jgi:hypothetical protein